MSMTAITPVQLQPQSPLSVGDAVWQVMLGDPTFLALNIGAEWGGQVTCGYFNLPKAAGETAIVSWEDLSLELRTAAEHCAAKVASAVAAGEFWPPTELAGKDAGWDEFAELFHQGAEASIDYTRLEVRK